MAPLSEISLSESSRLAHEQLLETKRLAELKKVADAAEEARKAEAEAGPVQGVQSYVYGGTRPSNYSRPAS